MSETLVSVAVSDETRADRRGKRADQGIYRDFLLAAMYFAERARADEQRPGAAEASAADFVRHRAYVTGAILSAAAFLEASINELYLELHGSRARDRLRLPRRVLPLLGRAWAAMRRTRVLERYQVVLKVADAERFDERHAPFLDADTLMKMRDALLHSRPERPVSGRRYRMLEKRLKGRFALNPMAAPDSPWFPHQCLSADCADWAIKAADDFTDAFCRRIALPARGLARGESPAPSRSTTVRARRGVADHVEPPAVTAPLSTGS
ncbi:MAG TPA: hypothetical protein VJ717_08365 [Gemmatimonadaceae bacterium]|nr:hypothetical protein [Gemmatimonadaceae bacterium]